MGGAVVRTQLRYRGVPQADWIAATCSGLDAVWHPKAAFGGCILRSAMRRNGYQAVAKQRLWFFVGGSLP